MGVTAQTPANLVIGAGDVEVDGSSQGVTADDNVFRIEQEIFSPDNLNGVPGTLVGTHYKVREEAILEVTWPEVSATTIGVMWPGVNAATVGEDTTLDTDGTERRLALDSFHDYELVLPGLEGRSVSFFIDNGLNMGAIEFTAQNAGMLSPRLELHSAWDAADLTASPHRIVITVPAS
jgi:hypothetical protein